MGKSLRIICQGLVGTCSKTINYSHPITFAIGMKVALVVNNLGGTSNLELAVVANSAIKYLGKIYILLDRS